MGFGGLRPCIPHPHGEVLCQETFVAGGGRGADPEAGGLFAMAAPVPGLAPDPFQPNGNGHPQ
jgi:hypothetical protein